MEMASMLSEVGHAAYCRRLPVLRELHKGWMDGKSLKVVSTSADAFEDLIILSVENTSVTVNYKHVRLWYKSMILKNK